jgi:Phage integrase family
MPRPATGQIVERQGKDGRTYRGLRFTAKGRRKYVSLGPVTLAAAERELRHVLADVERGIWQPVRASPRSGSQPLPTFHEYAEDWWLRHERRLRPKTQCAAKLAEEDPLSARSINMTVILLGAILEGAVERELISRNPARGRGRRVRERTPRRSYLERAAQVRALLDAAARLRAKQTAAAPDAFVFPTSTGKRQSADNLRSRVISASAERASRNLRARELTPLPEKITPHSLRRSFASILYAIGEDPGVVMDEMGHTDPALALRVYRQSMRRGENEKAALRALVEGPTRS